MIDQLSRLRRAQYLLAVFTALFTLFSLLRVVFYFGFWHIRGTEAVTLPLLAHAWSIGARFDFRLAAIACLPLFIVGLLPRVGLLQSAVTRKLASMYVVLAVAILGFVYIIDFGHYAYLGIRVDSSVLHFLEDATISAQMLWESYNVVWITLAWISTIAVFAGLMRPITSLLSDDEFRLPRWQRGTALTLLFIVSFGVSFGRWSLVPLRWSDAYINGSVRLGSMGLNPVLYFADSFQFADVKFDENEVRKYYRQMANYLGIEPAFKSNGEPNYDRTIDPAGYTVVNPGERRPNVVFIMMESLGANRMGIFNNPYDPTPNLDRIAREGWFFRNLYVPITSTARTVFGSITGLADVSTVEMATRNPLITEQCTIVNELKGYEKYYFIGGSAGWANMQAMIQRSIKGVRMHQEGSYTSPVIDVWGISDLDLFKEANQILTKIPKDQPFFAYIQMADNHRPFTIPDENDGFKRRDDISEKELANFGFLNRDQFNAVRLEDFNIGRFMEIAKEGGYLNNTIFVMFGDHNDQSTQSPHMAPFHDAFGFDILHVPGIIYAPGYLQPKEITDAVSMLDMLPTAAGLAGFKYRNTTLGRDVNQVAPEGERMVFGQVSDKRAPIIHAITNHYMVRMNYDFTDVQLHDITSDHPEIDISKQYPEMAKQMSEWLKGYYETTRYLHYHNSSRFRSCD